jgi:hypothetical protein
MLSIQNWRNLILFSKISVSPKNDGEGLFKTEEVLEGFSSMMK